MQINAAKKPKSVSPKKTDWTLVVNAAAQACWLASAWAVERKKPRRAAYQTKEWAILTAIESGDMSAIKEAMDAPLQMPTA